MGDFFLMSVELQKEYAPVACRVVRRLRSEQTSDLALVELDPPLPAHVYHTDRELRWLIVGARYADASLFPVSEWPLTVNVLRTISDEIPSSDVVAGEHLKVLDWGELRREP